jgi:hypothetical protein
MVRQDKGPHGASPVKRLNGSQLIAAIMHVVAGHLVCTSSIIHEVGQVQRRALDIGNDLQGL